MIPGSIYIYLFGNSTLSAPLPSVFYWMNSLIRGTPRRLWVARRSAVGILTPVSLLRSFVISEDVSTDGKWCYVVYWVIPCPDLGSVNWAHLKNRLLSACPSPSISFYFDSGARAASSQVYLLKVLCIDRKGLLNGKHQLAWSSWSEAALGGDNQCADWFSGFVPDVTRILGELELIIQRVKVSTTPDGRVVDFFFITDGM